LAAQVKAETRQPLARGDKTQGYLSGLLRQLRCCRAWEWACCWLTTIGQACRAIAAEAVRTTLAWAISQVSERARAVHWYSAGRPGTSFWRT
jgi:hypothetical protein